MRKTLSILTLIILLSGCSQIINNVDLKKKIILEKPIEQKILGLQKYSLDCKTKYLTRSLIGGDLNPETYIEVKSTEERETLYVDQNSAKFFGADYSVLQDDSLYLVIMRNYSGSGLTEIISIDKKTGIGFGDCTIFSVS